MITAELELASLPGKWTLALYLFGGLVLAVAAVWALVKFLFGRRP